MDNITQGEHILEDYAIHELQNAYNTVLPPEKQALRGKNTSNWNDSHIKTDTYRGPTPLTPANRT
jgi:hypothetical protein